MALEMSWVMMIHSPGESFKNRVMTFVSGSLFKIQRTNSLEHTPESFTAVG